MRITAPAQFQLGNARKAILSADHAYWGLAARGRYRGGGGLGPDKAEVAHLAPLSKYLQDGVSPGKTGPFTPISSVYLLQAPLRPPPLSDEEATIVARLVDWSGGRKVCLPDVALGDEVVVGEVVGLRSQKRHHFASPTMRLSAPAGARSLRAAWLRLSSGSRRLGYCAQQSCPAPTDDTQPR